VTAAIADGRGLRGIRTTRETVTVDDRKSVTDNWNMITDLWIELTDDPPALERSIRSADVLAASLSPRFRSRARSTLSPRRCSRPCVRSSAATSRGRGG
jgi:hypothetical protein